MYVCKYIYMYVCMYPCKYINTYIPICRDFPGGSVVKNLPANAGDAGAIPG